MTGMLILVRRNGLGAGAAIEQDDGVGLVKDGRWARSGIPGLGGHAAK